MATSRNATSRNATSRNATTNATTSNATRKARKGRNGYDTRITTTTRDGTRIGTRNTRGSTTAIQRIESTKTERATSESLAKLGKRLSTCA